MFLPTAIRWNVETLARLIGSAFAFSQAKICWAIATSVYIKYWEGITRNFARASGVTRVLSQGVNFKSIKMLAKGVQFSDLACQGEAHPCPPAVTPLARACSPRPNNVSRLAVERTMYHAGTTSARPSIAASSEPQWGLTLIEPLLP